MAPYLLALTTTHNKIWHAVLLVEPSNVVIIITTTIGPFSVLTRKTNLVMTLLVREQA